MIVGLLGFFDLAEVWRRDVAPDVRSSVSPSIFKTLDSAITEVLNEKQVYWATIGALFAVWQASGVVRACGQTLNRIYEVEDDRTLAREVGTSVAAGLAIAVLMIAALVIVRFGPDLAERLLGEGPAVGVLSFIVRWTLASLILLVVVGVIARTGPGIERPLRWVGFGSLVTVAGWVVMTILLGLYLSEAGGFGDVYGSLLTTFLLFEYLYLASIVFLGGLVLDRLVEQEG